MRFHVLGPVRLGSHTPSAAKIRAVLGVLLVQTNKVVAIDALIDELWGESPPRTATTTVQVYVSHLRKACAAQDAESGAPDFGESGRLVTAAPGYLMRTDPDELDVTRFEALRANGMSASEQGDLTTASHLLREALRVWSGPALSGVPRGALLNATAVRLEEQRMSALDLAIATDLKLGRHRDLLGELMALALAHPFDERVHAHLMVALYRSDRQLEALRVFSRIRRTLVDEIGTEPGAALRRLHQRILRSDPELLWRPSGRLTMRQAAPARHRAGVGAATAAAGAHEHAGLVTAVQHAYHAGLWHVAWNLADGLRHYLQDTGAWPEWETVNDIALAAARRLGDENRIETALRTRELIRRSAGAAS